MRLPGEAEALSIPNPRQGVVPGVRDPSAIALANAGQKVVSAANELQDAFERKQRHLDKLQAEDLYNQAIAQSIELKAGEDGYIHKKSSDAVNGKLREEYLGRLDKFTETLYEKVKTPRQKEMLKARLDNLRNNVSSDILGHVIQEEGVWQKQVLEGTAVAVSQEAAERWQSKGAIDAQRVRWKDAVDTYAEENGLDKVARDKLYLAGATDLHKAVIERAVNAGNSGYARMWLNANRKEIDADVAANIDASLKTSGTREESQRQADKIYSMGISDSAKLAKAREIANPEVRDATVTRIKARIAEDEGLDNQEKKDASDQAWKIVAAGGNEWDVPNTVWNEMEGTTQIAIQNYISTRNQGKPVKTNYSLYYGLQQAARVDPDAFVRTDLNQFVDRLAGPEFKSMIELQKDILDGGKALETVRTKDQVMKQGLVDAGLDPAELTKDSNAGIEARAFYRRVDTEAQAFQEKTGKPPTGKDLADIVDRLSLQVIQGRKWYWPFLGERPAGLVTIEGIPDDMVDDLAFRVKQAGQPVTEENIRKLYEFITNPPAPGGPYGR